jgi:thioesterase domain-containing protein
VERRNVEDIFRLTEAQEALLLHTVQGRGADAGFLQLRATVLGPLDVNLFRRAWHETVSRHPMLRGSVHWQRLKHPVQVIARHAELAVEVLDLSGLSEPERLMRLDQTLDDDRRSGVDLSTAPVMRVTIVRQAAGSHELLWTCHHVLLDGWSGAIVLNEVVQRYRAFRHGNAPDLPSAGSFRQYVAWARAQDSTAAEHFWRARLINDGRSCLANSGPVDSSSEDKVRATAAVSIAADPVEAWARTHGVTVSCVIFGCWALLLHVRTSTERPVFGATFSGRSVDVERFGAVVGMFANTVPLQVAVEPALPVPVWFRRVFAHQQEAQQFEYAPLGRILSWAGISSRPPLFDSLIVHTNYPHHDPGGEQPAGPNGDIRLTEFRGAVTSTFPVTLVVKPEHELILELVYAPARVPCGAADRILQEFRRLVERVVSAGHATVADVLPALGAEPHPPVRATPAGLPDRLREVANKRPCYPAGDAVEAQLMRIFDDLIDVRQIGRDDNFFELGGDSLLVPLLIDRIEGDFAVTLPLGVIFEAPTVRALAAAVTAGNPNSSWQSLVAIREHGCRPPLYLVHGLGGEIDHFYNLVRYLHPEQPVYALQPPPAEQTALEQIAEHYVREIRLKRQSGPYLLGGYCIGGCIAFEMARQLIEAGERVPLLMIIDSASPGTRPRPQDPPSLVTRVRRLASCPPAEVLERVKRRVEQAVSRLGAGLPPPGDPDALPADVVPRAFYGLATRHFKALRAYRPRPLNADVCLFRSQDDRFAPDMGWGPLVDGRFRIEMIPGSHANVLKYPHVPGAAQKIAAVLETIARPT